jgi:hypothetical protein
MQLRVGRRARACVQQQVRSTPCVVYSSNLLQTM